MIAPDDTTPPFGPRDSSDSIRAIAVLEDPADAQLWTLTDTDDVPDNELARCLET